jgi:4-carboxymuconolactone decarboxylase
MKTISIKTLMGFVIAAGCFSFILNAQNNMNENATLSPREQSIVAIAAFTAKGDLSKLKTALNTGLEAGLTINQIKEAIVHLYAYCGFPRSIRGLQTFMDVLNERKARGINDVLGAEASPIQEERSKYERGREVLGKLTGAPQDGPKTGYSAFAPVMDVFLKEHLFADIFERDVLTYAERELVTISVISSIGGAEPMLRSHLNICLHVGLTPEQLHQFVNIIKTTVGKKEAQAAQKILDDVLTNR